MRGRLSLLSLLSLLVPLLAATASCHLVIDHAAQPGAVEAGRDRTAADQRSDTGGRDQGVDQALARDLGADQNDLDQGKAPDKKLSVDQGKAPDKKLSVDQGKTLDVKLSADQAKTPDKAISLDKAGSLDAPPGSDSGSAGCSCSVMAGSCTSTCITRTVQCTFLAGQWSCSCTTWSGTVLASFPISPAFTGCQACDVAASLGFDGMCNEIH